MRIETGGAAFPHPDGYLNANGDLVFHENTGMTLRDYFAAQALPAVIAISNNQSIINDTDLAYTYADAMLAERAKAQSAQEK